MPRRHTTVWASGAVLFAIFILFPACGGGPPTTTPPPNEFTDDPGDKGDETPPVNPNTPYNLELYAEISSNPASAPGTAFHPINIADGWLGNPDGSVNYQVWIPPGAPNSASVTLTWNGQVNISEIQMHDVPTRGQVLGGQIVFIKADGSEDLPVKRFDALPDDGKTPLKVTGPGAPVKAIRIEILSHKPERVNEEGQVLSYGVGISEVTIIGTRVNEATKKRNVAIFGHVPKKSGGGYSSILNPLYPQMDAGANQAIHVHDGSNSSCWISDGNGNSAYVQLKFDRSYTIESISFTELPGGPAIGEMWVRFLDSNERKKLPLAEPVTSNALEFDLEGTSGNSGLCEVTVQASYTP